MEFGDLLQGVGLFMCIGAIVLIALVAIAARTLTRSRNPTVQRGPGEPRYDDREIESGSEFGGVPTTGSVQSYERDVDNAPETTLGSSGFGGARTYESPADVDRDSTTRSPDDDDDVPSPGGIGSG